MAIRSWTKSSALFGGASLLALSLGVTTPALAQAAPGEEVEELVVTGFRGSLQQALTIKRDSSVASDAILAEDIGKFPDLNLSESIQRISGVAITREGGEGRQISVRGLGPQFTRVRINGMEALTTAGGTDANGGTNRGRSFDFNIFASDLFSAITVQKTASAQTEEGSLGATVDLRTARPLDYDGFKLSASAQASYNDLSSEVSPRMAGMISNTWADGTFGALVSVAYNKRKTQDEGTSTVRWATGNAFAPGFESGPAGGPSLAQLNAAYHPRFPRFDKYTQEQERIGATVALQWAPSDRTKLNFDFLYADLSGTREETFLEAPSFSVGGACTPANRLTTCGIADTDVRAGVIDGANTLVSGTFDDVDLRVEDRFDELETKFTQYSLDFTHEFSDSFRLRAMAGHSKSDHDNPVQTTLTWDQFNVDGYSYDYSQGRVPLIQYGNANLTDPAPWTLSSVRLRPQTAVNTYDTVQAEVQYDLNEILTVQAGLSWKSYDFKTTELRRSNGTATNQESVVPPGARAIPLGSYTQLVDFPGDGLGMPAGNATSWIAPDLGTAADVLSLYDPTAFGGAWRLGPEPALGNNRSVDEEDKGGFVQVDFATEIASMPFRGNFGVRYVKTQQSASGYTFVSGSAVPITVDRSYDDTLPSMNLVLEPFEGFLIRFGAAQTMSRPDLGNLTPGATISVSGANRTVTAGNPNLDPFRAKAYDLSFEWYYSPEALVSVALFRKDVDSFVQTLTTNSSFSDNPFGLPDSVAIAACGTTPGCSPSSSWNFSAPRNTPGGTVEGFELSFQQPFTFLPGLLANFGVLANYTYVKSEIDYLNAAGAVIATNDIVGLSRKAYNATLYYEDDKWSGRVSASYRDRYLTRVPGQEAGTSYDGTNETFNVDASLTYSWNDNLKFTVEGVNLTDEFADQFVDASNRLQFYHHTGREFLVGVRYTY